MFHLFKLLRNTEFRKWSRRKKIAGIAILILVVVLIALMPDMAVFAGVFDVSMLDILITFLGLQLLLYSDQILAFASLAYDATSRRIGKIMGRAKSD